MESTKKLFESLKRVLFVFLAGAIVLTTAACGTTTQAAVPVVDEPQATAASGQDMYPYEDNRRDTTAADAKAARTIEEAKRRIERVDTPKDYVDELTSRATLPGQAQNDGNSVQEAAEDLGRSTKQTARKAKRSTERAVEDAGDAAERLVRDRSPAARAAEDVGKSTRRAAEDVGDSAQEAVENVTDNTRQGLRNLKDNIGDAADQVGDTIERIVD